MNGDRFDDLSKALASAASRRTLLKTLAGGLAGALLTARARGQAQAHGGPLPPFPCVSNAFCPPTSYCQFPQGVCQGIGTCRPRPEVCLAVYEPVCGGDGRTYGNACEAARAGVSVAYRGPCRGAGVGCQPVGGVCLSSTQCCGEATCDGASQTCVCLVQAACAPGYRWDAATCQCVPADNATGRFCGGIAAVPCPAGYTCVDDPRDDCDPQQGGADCPGICVPTQGDFCRTRFCGPDEYCCNFSCGICAPRGGVCTQQLCP